MLNGWAGEKASSGILEYNSVKGALWVLSLSTGKGHQ